MNFSAIKMTQAINLAFLICFSVASVPRERAGQCCTHGIHRGWWFEINMPWFLEISLEIPIGGRCVCVVWVIRPRFCETGG